MDSKGIIESIRSGVSGIHIQGKDIPRMDSEIEMIAQQLNFKITEWNQGYGWVDFNTKRALRSEQAVSLFEDLKTIADDDPTKKLYVIQDAHSALKNEFRTVARLKQELLRINRHFMGQSAIILVTNENVAFSELADLVASYYCLPLGSKEIEQVFQLFIEEHSITVNTAVKRSLISIFSGMERHIVLQICQLLNNRYDNYFPHQAAEDALVLKKRVLSQSGLLELVDSSIRIEQIGGLEQLKTWLNSKKHIIDDLPRAQRFGISAPTGVLLAGMPGCGKSMSAMAAASLFHTPLFRLDIGSLMGKFVGESEANMKAALKAAEQASPCVLWIDELEKAFSGINGSGGSTEITTRLFGYFLTWMQEKPGAVFVIATANDITSIPAELLRRGRFDEIFYVNLPSERERKQIFKVKLKSLPYSPESLNLDELAKKSNGFSGADIECVINDTLEDLFRNGKTALTQDTIKKHINQITPISIVLEEKIAHYQELFSKLNLKPASFSEEDIKDINAKSNSDDASERENAASNEFISPEKLIQLIDDDSLSVRLAALKNPQCPFEALKNIIDAYEAFDFSKPGSWSANEVTEDEFNLALQHPNINGKLILQLYRMKRIDTKKLLSLTNKLSLEERKSTFRLAKIKLSRSISSGLVQSIRCFPEEIIDSGDTLVEIDNEKGHTQQVTASINGLVAKVSVKVGQSINAGEEIAQILVPKNRG